MTESISPPLPRSGHARAWWRAPASPSGLVLAIAKDNHGAHQLESDLRTLLAHDASIPVLPFPDWETLPYDQFSPHPDIVSQRLSALHRLPTLKRGILV